MTRYHSLLLAGLLFPSQISAAPNPQDTAAQVQRVDDKNKLDPVYPDLFTRPTSNAPITIDGLLWTWKRNPSDGSIDLSRADLVSDKTVFTQHVEKERGSGDIIITEQVGAGPLATKTTSRYGQDNFLGQKITRVGESTTTEDFEKGKPTSYTYDDPPFGTKQTKEYEDGRLTLETNRHISTSNSGGVSIFMTEDTTLNHYSNGQKLWESSKEVMVNGRSTGRITENVSVDRDEKTVISGFCDRTEGDDFAPLRINYEPGRPLDGTGFKRAKPQPCAPEAFIIK